MTLASATNEGNAAKAPRTRRKVGRPPKLTLEAVIDAALRCDLETLTMAGLAQQLNVAVGALYGYVENRDDLIQMALIRKVSTYKAPNDNLHWSEFMFAHAQMLHEMYHANPGMLSQALEGRPGPEATLEGSEQVLRVLTKAGFGVADATSMMEAMTTIVVGAATGAIYRRKAEAGGEALEARMQRAIARRPAEDLAVHREHLSTIMARRFKPPWQQMIYLILKDKAAQLGETLPFDEPAADE